MLRQVNLLNGCRTSLPAPTHKNNDCYYFCIHGSFFIPNNSDYLQMMVSAARKRFAHYYHAGLSLVEPSSGTSSRARGKENGDDGSQVTNPVC